MKDLLYRRLSNLRVADIMQRNVVQISAQQTMGQAAAVLSRHAISGTPVVDSLCRCVGILSANDFVHRDAAEACRESSAEASPSVAATDSVAAYMTPTVTGIEPGESLRVAGEIMCRSHIHRLPVLDASGTVVGMVTSLDIVAALVNALDEAE